MPLRIDKSKAAGAAGAAGTTLMADAAVSAAAMAFASTGEAAFDTRTGTFSGRPSPAASLPAASLPLSRPGHLFHLADRIFGKVLAIDKTSLEILLKHADFSSLPAISSWDDDDPDDDDEEDNEYATYNGIAIIPISGPLFKRESFLTRYFGLATYQGLARQISAALANDSVKGIMLDVDSPGGESAGCSELSDFIYSARGSKPIYAISNDAMYSGAYWLASAADKLYLTRDAGVGSIGCYMMHLDRSGLDEQLGLKFTYIYAGDKKVDGNPHEPLSKSALVTLQGEVDRIRDMFVTSVARNRGITAQSVIDTQAGVYFAQSAIPALADQLGTMADAMTDLMRVAGVDEDYGGDEGMNSQDPDHKPMMKALRTQSSKMFVFSLPQQKFVGPIAPHKTATSTGSWDGPANEARLKLDQSATYYRRAYAWVDSSKDQTKKAAYRYVHHMVDSRGNIGAANVQACRSGIGVLNGARGGTTIPTADRKGVWNHLAKHLRDAGIEPPELKSEAEYAQVLADTNIQHSALTARVLARMNSDRSVDKYAVPTFTPEACVRSFGLNADQPTPTAMVVQAPGDASKEKRVIRLLVAPYNSQSIDMGGYREVYAPNCFKNGLDNDPHVLNEHNEAQVLGRQSAGTARFIETPDGLWAEADAPDTSWANDLLVSLSRGDVDQSSAAFWILQHRWETRSGERIRVIERALLREASVKSFPAYESASASVQPAQSSQQQHQHVANPHPSTGDASLDPWAARLRLLQLAR